MEAMFNLLKQKSQEFLSKSLKPKLLQLMDKLLMYYLQVTSFLLALSRQYYLKVSQQMLTLTLKSLNSLKEKLHCLRPMVLKVMDKNYLKVLLKKLWQKGLDLFKTSYQKFKAWKKVQ